MLRKIFFPVASSELELRLLWRLVKLSYFVLLGIGGGVTYTLINSWTYTNCPMDASKTWEEIKPLCTPLFPFLDMIIAVLISYLIARLLFPILVKSADYLIGTSN